MSARDSDGGDVVERLRDLWLECFGEKSSMRDPRDLADRSEKWSDHRADHLPWTLEVLLRGLPPLRYGRADQEGTGTPVLLLMAGYSEEQLALVVATHVRASRCQKVVPFTGAGVWPEIRNDLNGCLRILDTDPAVLDEHVTINPSEPADVFRKVSDWLRSHPEMRPAIDCTGGQKPMDAGAAHAASFYGLPAYYLDFTGYDVALRRPKPWTSIYRELELPDAVYSLAWRRRVLEAYRGRRFHDALVWIAAIGRGADASRFFDDESRRELHQAGESLARAAAWDDLRYEHLTLRNHPLHSFFLEVAARVSTAEEMKKSIESLLSPERFDLFFRYVVDEYWRLRMRLDQGEKRDVLVGCVGLTELLVDYLFREAWSSRLRIVGAQALYWVDQTPSPIPDVTCLQNQALPGERIAPSASAKKIQLLRDGRAGRVPLQWASAASLGLKVDRADANRRIAVVADVELDGGNAPLHGLSKDVWAERWGRFPHSDWVLVRHGLVHLRAPLFDEQVFRNEAATTALDEYVPRFMELVRRIHVEEALDLAQSSNTAWVKWRGDPRWSRETCARWVGSEHDLETWLRLRL